MSRNLFETPSIKFNKNYFRGSSAICCVLVNGWIFCRFADVPKGCLLIPVHKSYTMGYNEGIKFIWWKRAVSFLLLRLSHRRRVVRSLSVHKGD